MSFYLSLVQVVFILSNSASFFTRRRSVPRPWNFFLSWIRAQTTPVFTTNCTILFVNFTADCTILFSTLQQNVQYFFSTLQQTVQYQTNNKLRFCPKPCPQITPCPGGVIKRSSTKTISSTRLPGEKWKRRQFCKRLETSWFWKGENQHQILSPASSEPKLLMRVTVSSFVAMLNFLTAATILLTIFSKDYLHSKF